MRCSGQELDGQDQHGKQEHKYAEAVDTVHIADPLVFRTLRILFSQVEILRDLFPYTHAAKFARIPEFRTYTRLATSTPTLSRMLKKSMGKV